MWATSRRRTSGTDGRVGPRIEVGPPARPSGSDEESAIDRPASDGSAMPVGSAPAALPVAPPPVVPPPPAAPPPAVVPPPALVAPPPVEAPPVVLPAGGRLGSAAVVASKDGPA